MLEQKGKVIFRERIILVSLIMFPIVWVIMGFNMLSERFGWIPKGNIQSDPLWMVILAAIFAIGLGVGAFYIMWPEIKRKWGLMGDK